MSPKLENKEMRPGTNAASKCQGRRMWGREGGVAGGGAVTVESEA